MLRLCRICVLSLLALTGVPAANAEQDDRPNLITIVTDDQAIWAVGLYGNAEIHTPNMDRLGAEGLVFSNAFVATPVCSPSRATYLTGLWPTEHGVEDWIAPFEAATGAGIAGMTWAHVLQRNGYRTGLIGKWHLGTSRPSHPKSMGFDHFMGFTGGGNKAMDPTLEVDGAIVRMKGPTPDLLVDDAIRFVRDNRDRPFALSVHFRAPHTPYGPVPEVDRRPYKKLDPELPNFEGLDPEQIKTRTRKYYASVSSIDRNLGRLLKLLDELDLAENTIVLFTSDHGYNEGRHGVTTKGNGRWIVGGQVGPTRPNMWDTSIRVPLMVRWPRKISPGSRTDHTVSNLDMYKTVLGALEIPIPADSKAHGVDFSPLLRGKALPDREVLFGIYDLHNAGLAHMRMIRTKKFKYVRSYRSNFRDELYDLQSDPGETTNLLRSAQRFKWAAVEKKLRVRLVAWQRSIDDPILSESD
jgi:choline-sulfatase